MLLNSEFNYLISNQYFEMKLTAFNTADNILAQVHEIEYTIINILYLNITKNLYNCKD